jgi:hypothetical protein
MVAKPAHFDSTTSLHGAMQPSDLDHPIYGSFIQGKRRDVTWIADMAME